MKCLAPPQKQRKSMMIKTRNAIKHIIFRECLAKKHHD